jgi:hypothetical protein
VVITPETVEFGSVEEISDGKMAVNRLWSYPLDIAPTWRRAVRQIIRALAAAENLEMIYFGRALSPPPIGGDPTLLADICQPTIHDRVSLAVLAECLRGTVALR